MAFGQLEIRDLFKSIEIIARRAYQQEISTADAYEEIKKKLDNVEYVVLTAKEEDL